MQHGIHEKTWVHARRKIFFDEIIAAIESEPTQIDYLLNGASHYVAPKPDSMVVDPERGTLYMEIVFATPRGAIDLSYSLFQLGKDIKVGLLMHPEHGSKIDADLFDDVWPGAKPQFAMRGDNFMWDWTFEELNLFERWTLQERYILGCRHMHFRVLNLLWAAFSVRNERDEKGGRAAVQAHHGRPVELVAAEVA